MTELRSGTNSLRTSTRMPRVVVPGVREAVLVVSLIIYGVGGALLRVYRNRVDVPSGDTVIMAWRVH